MVHGFVGLWTRLRRFLVRIDGNRLGAGRGKYCDGWGERGNETTTDLREIWIVIVIGLIVALFLFLLLLLLFKLAFVNGL
jgi:hypothetical protein